MDEFLWLVSLIFPGMIRDPPPYDTSCITVTGSSVSKQTEPKGVVRGRDLFILGYYILCSTIHHKHYTLSNTHWFVVRSTILN